jgi:hypothetical protein
MQLRVGIRQVLPQNKVSLNSLCGISLNATCGWWCGGGPTSPDGQTALNSLCGISLNATGVMTLYLANAFSLGTLNSLCGISLNATLEIVGEIDDLIIDDSQFPLWDFFECNTEAEAGRKEGRHIRSQFPLWDFFECNFR